MAAQGCLPCLFLDAFVFLHDCLQVESHPFDLDTMLFMDWRDDHTQGNPSMQVGVRPLRLYLCLNPVSVYVVWILVVCGHVAAYPQTHK